MEKSLHKTNLVLLWCNLVAVFLYAGGNAMMTYLASSHQGTTGAWQFLFGVMGLCLFGFGLQANYQAKGVTAKRGVLMTEVWLSVLAGVLGFVFAFVTSNVLGIITAVVSAVAFICAIMAVRK